MVEGAGSVLDDRLSHLICVLQHVGSSDPQHLISLFFKHRRSRHVPLRPVTHIMRGAVDLDHQLRCRAVKVRAILTDRVLFSECDAFRRALEPLP
jgi:hypothetical protein